MAVYNDGYDNEEERKADLAWEYRKGGPNDPNLYAEEEPEEDAEEEVRLIDAEELKRKFQDRSYWTYTHEYGDAIPIDWIMSGIDNAPTVERPQVNVIPQECMKVLAEVVVDVVQQIDWKALCEKVAERPHGEWIAVKDKLPDKEGEYLVSLDNGRIVVADGRGIIENHDFAPKMLAWRPLPEPYCATGGDPA